MTQDHPKTLSWGLFALLVLCLLSYGYFVRSTIVNIVLRQNAEQALVALNSNISNLEADYIKAKNDVTMEFALSQGFVPVSGEKFVSQDKKSLGLSVKSN